jgi:TP901-1 family phage major tail protein
MPAFKGRDVLIKYNTTGSTYVTIGGAREMELKIANEAVDVTNSDDAGVRKLLEGAGVNSVSITLSGVYMDDASWTAIRAAGLANTHKNFQFVMPKSPSGVYTYQGSFMIEGITESASYNGPANYNITLQSAGAVSFT